MACPAKSGLLSCSVAQTFLKHISHFAWVSTDKTGTWLTFHSFIYLWSHSVAIIMAALHAECPRFEPQRNPMWVLKACTVNFPIVGRIWLCGSTGTQAQDLTCIRQACMGGLITYRTTVINTSAWKKKTTNVVKKWLCLNHELTVVKNTYNILSVGGQTLKCKSQWHSRQLLLLVFECSALQWRYCRHHLFLWNEASSKGRAINTSDVMVDKNHSGR